MRTSCPRQTADEGLAGPPGPSASSTRVLAVASTGGHLAELHRLIPRMFTRAGVDWVTFDTAQSRSLLCDEEVKYVRRVRPRELSSLLANVYPTLSILRNRRYDVVVASGSAGLTFLPLAAVFGGEAHFIECATRTTGPSLSGRLLAVFRGLGDTHSIVAGPAARGYTGGPFSTPITLTCNGGARGSNGLSSRSG
jgi:hypothetical protein